jgi:FMN-dependent oxidoreductase (nitrilotriacetate monooxygenase family)
MYPGGHHIAGWRHPAAPAHTYTTLDYYRIAAQLAERGKFDIFFVGDTLATRNKGKTFFGRQAIPNLDPVSLCAAVSAVTSHIGVVATLSTTYHEPDYVATKFATLDHVSGGRAGWNVVTTFDPAAAFNFGRKGLLEKSLRYERGGQFVDAVTRLWNSCGTGAVVADRRSGRFFDASAVDLSSVEDSSFILTKPLRLPRPPQGWPVLVQAGGSPHGRDLAARYAEVIFTAQPDIEEAKAFRREMHTRMAAFGRPPDQLAILPGLSPILASNDDEARRKEEELDDLVHPDVAMWMLSKTFAFDFERYDLHDALPIAELRQLPKSTANNDTLLSAAERGKMTILAAAKWLTRSRSHHAFVGTPVRLADVMQHWLETGACDGFNLMPSIFPTELATFVEHVVPELQRRGIFRHDYEGTTLRSHLGLKMPPTSQTGSLGGPNT